MLVARMEAEHQAAKKKALTERLKVSSRNLDQWQTLHDVAPDYVAAFSEKVREQLGPFKPPLFEEDVLPWLSPAFIGNVRFSDVEDTVAGILERTGREGDRELAGKIAYELSRVAGYYNPASSLPPQPNGATPKSP